MAEDLGEEDVVGLVLRFEPVATDGGVGGAQVAWFPGLVEGAEGVRNVLGELRACGRVDGIGAHEAFEIPELSERPDNFLWVGQDGDWVRLEASAGSLTGFELAIEDNGGKGEFLLWQAELGAKEYLGRPASGQRHETHAFFEVRSLAVRGSFEFRFRRRSRTYGWASETPRSAAVAPGVGFR